ncbi:MAG: hypothetical protein PHE50_00860 [Dehalococcoidales bacterium]|nr:hypothetical protein [Dehalococcoidales bacterium]
MGPVVLIGIALAVLLLVIIALWETFKTVRRFSVSVWHFFIDSKPTR